MSGRFLLKIIIKKALVGDDVRFRDIVLIVSLLVHTQHFYFSFFFLFLVAGKRSVQEADRDADNTPTTFRLAPRFRRHLPRQSPRCPSAPLTPTPRDGKQNKITTGNHEGLAHARTARRVVFVFFYGFSVVFAKKEKKKNTPSNQLIRMGN